MGIYSKDHTFSDDGYSRDHTLSDDGISIDPPKATLTFYDGGGILLGIPDRDGRLVQFGFSHEDTLALAKLLKAYRKTNTRDG